LPRRRRARGQRPRTTQQREGEAPPPREARPALSIAAPEEAPPQAGAPRRVSPSTGTAAKTASRHISRDYSYVPGELKRIAITVGVIVAGLAAVAIALR